MTGLSRLLNTTSFRLALLYLVVFALSATALLTFLYLNTAGNMAAVVDSAIDREIADLEQHYKQRGLGGLRQVIIERSARTDLSIYILANGDRSRIAGNLLSWPAGPIEPGGWANFNFERPTAEGAEIRPARARRMKLPGNFLLLVGRDVHVPLSIARNISEVLFWASAVTLVLGITGGIFFSRYMVRRLDVINKTSRAIIQGDFTKRVPISGNSDEFDELAANLNRMLDQIEKLMTSMRDVADNIAHDLRTPLNRLRSRLEMTLLKPAGAEEYAATLESTISEVDGLIATFNALLLIAETESGAVRENMEDFDLAAAARDVAELYEPVAEERSITLRANAAAPAFIHGNRMLVSQALANMIDNAIKYGREGGRIDVTVAAKGETCALGVADDGPGIPAADRERVLERFVRLEASRNARGSGLGLSLVAAVAHMHDAELALEDAMPGLRVSLAFKRAQAPLLRPVPLSEPALSAPPALTAAAKVPSG